MKKKQNVTVDWHTLTGKLWFRCTNDYLFRALMQKYDDIRTAFIATLIGCEVEDIDSCVVENPIVLGETIEDKDFILDIRVSVNDALTMNVEMQVINRYNWPERSVSYLCRTFDDLKTGQDYIEVRPVWQVGITDFQVFKDRNDFYGTYMLLNLKSYKLYTDKFKISVIDLTNIDNATEADKRAGLDRWAMMFKATTWEDLKGLAEEDPVIEKAVGYMHVLSEEEMIKERMWAREEFYRNERTNQKLMEMYKGDAEKYKGDAEKYKQMYVDQEAKLADKDAKLADQEAKLAEYERKYGKL
ncbi:MAG: Rpn family recombination-promoting nuclease/putative transposase [Lachnospiraceae bacterium]|nr:Rpn family recombination-promoting nuclease/putative transposase [Lachnospiraceae bacterium]